MLDEYLEREDVQLFIRYIKNMSTYRDKKTDVSSKYSLYDNGALSLYVFYDALLKYVIILDDKKLFIQYLEQLKKIYTRSVNLEDVRLSINKLICKMVSIKLDIKDFNQDVFKKQIISYVYNKYILGGYLVHGFSTVYERNLINSMFVPEIYVNNYNKMIEINKIFNKYCNSNIIDKDFTNNNVYFTSDIVMGCIYSIYSPGYFFNFLLNNHYYGKKSKKELYLKGNYNKCVSYLKKFMDNNLFSEKDKRYVLSVVSDEWNYIHSVKRKISLLVVRREKIIKYENVRLRDFINSDGDIYEVIDRILSPKRNNVPFNEILNTNEFEILSLDDLNDGIIEDDKLTIEADDATKDCYKEIHNMNNSFLNEYGKASIFIVLGSLFISLGVLITILLIVKGS